MKTLEIAVPDEIFVALKASPQELADEIRLAAAAKLLKNSHHGIQEERYS